MAIAIKAIHLQVYEGEWLSKEASRQYRKVYHAPAKRGTIYDRNFRELAVTVDSYSVFAHPGLVKDKSRVIEKLSQIINIKPDMIEDKLCSDKKFVWIKRMISPDQVKKIKELDLKGIDFAVEPGRAYPNRELCSQVIGFTGIDGNGLEGLEFFYNNYLQGKTASSLTIKDAYGRSFIPTDTANIKEFGNDLVLTLDRTIQFITERELKNTVKNSMAKSAMAIIMIPSTGEILAIAHYPSFNPNIFEQYQRSLWRNRAVTDPFEPGSTMKIFIAAAAIEYKICNINSLFYCENGSYQINSKTIHDSHPHGWLDLEDVIKYSSNIGAIKIGTLLGSEAVYNALYNFGFGQKTTVDCPAETTGTLIDYKKWTELDRGAISFGHGISVSAIQLISAACAIANKGIYMQPFLVKTILDYNGRKVLENFPKQVKKVVSKQTSDDVKLIMESVVSPGGTGENAALEGYSVCGKTGTSHKLNPDGTYAKDKYLASFIGFVPSNNPALAILVIVDEPQSGFYGGKVAAPAFRRIAYETLEYLNIIPETNEN